MSTWRDRRKQERKSKRYHADTRDVVRSHPLNKPMTDTQRFAVYLNRGLKE